MKQFQFIISMSSMKKIILLISLVFLLFMTPVVEADVGLHSWSSHGGMIGGQGEFDISMEYERVDCKYLFL